MPVVLWVITNFCITYYFITCFNAYKHFHTQNTHKHLHFYGQLYTFIPTNIHIYIYVSLRLSVFDAYSIYYIFPPVSLCVLSLCTPNLDFERGGCWRTRVTHDRRTVFSRTNARPWRELINSEIDRVKLTLFALVGN